MTKAEIEAICEHARSAFDGDSIPEKNIALRNAYAMLRALSEENERLKLQRDEAREQFDKHVAWASDQQAAAEARAIAAEEAVKNIRQSVVPPIGDDYAYGKGWNAARKQTLERIDAALAQKEGG